MAAKYINRWLCLVLIGIFVFCGFLGKHVGQQPSPTDLRTSIVEGFMSARTLPQDVEARKLMTASLEENYMHGKRLSIRVRSGRIVAYDFGPSLIKTIDDSEFSAEVESLWADLNEQVFATQYERIKFIKLRNDWLADDIEFLKSVPGRRVLPFNVVSEKRGKFAIAVVKKFMKDFINRQPKSAIQSMTQEFQSRFQSQQELEAFLAGTSDPHYAAYELHTLTQTDPSQMEVKLRIYLVTTGKKGNQTKDARLVVKEGKTDWNIDEFEFVKS